MKEDILSHLAELGFSGVEAAAYVALLREPHATGYRVARVIDKPVPNTYKALDALHRKGAVILDESGRGRTYSALPIGEYLEGMKRNIDNRRMHIEEELKGLTADTRQAGIYQLGSAEQVYGRCQTMLREAKGVVLVDIFPAPLKRLRPDIEAAAKRGVKVLMLVYEPVEVKGCEVIAPKKSAAQLEIWTADWLNMVVDSREYVYALLNKDGRGAHRAVWSKDPYLAMQAFSGAWHELVLDRMGQLLWCGKSKDEIASELRRMSQTYVTDDTFYAAVGPWVNKEKIRELRRQAMKAEKKTAGRKGKPECKEEK